MAFQSSVATSPFSPRIRAKSRHNAASCVLNMLTRLGLFFPILSRMKLNQPHWPSHRRKSQLYPSCWRAWSKRSLSDIGAMLHLRDASSIRSDQLRRIDCTLKESFRRRTVTAGHRCLVFYRPSPSRSALSGSVQCGWRHSVQDDSIILD